MCPPVVRLDRRELISLRGAAHPRQRKAGSGHAEGYQQGDREPGEGRASRAHGASVNGLQEPVRGPLGHGERPLPCGAQSGVEDGQDRVPGVQRMSDCEACGLAVQNDFLVDLDGHAVVFVGDVLEEVGVREVGDLLEVEVGSPLKDRREVAPVGADDDGDLRPRQVVRRDLEAVRRGGERRRADDPHAVHRAIDVAAEGDLRLGGNLVEDLEEPAGLVGVILGHRSSWLVGGASWVRCAIV